MANYIKIKGVELMQSHIAMARKGSWVLGERENIEEKKRGLRKLKREAERRSDEGNALKGKTT